MLWNSLVWTTCGFLCWQLAQYMTEVLEFTCDFILCLLPPFQCIFRDSVCHGMCHGCHLHYHHLPWLLLCRALLKGKVSPTLCPSHLFSLSWLTHGATPNNLDWTWMSQGSTSSTPPSLSFAFFFSTASLLLVIWLANPRFIKCLASAVTPIRG